MANKEYKFQYMPLDGKLAGRVMEQQTEDAINDLGIWLVDVSDTADSALTIAQDAYDRAVNAQETADKAQSAAENAQNTADEALRGSEAAQTEIDKLEKTVEDHINDKDNPHEVTADQLGLENAIKYQGTVETYEDLPTGVAYGDTYTVETAYPDLNIKAGDSVVWNGEGWVNLSGVFDTTEIDEKIEAAQETADNALNVGTAAQTTADEALSQISQITSYVVTPLEDDDGELTDLDNFAYFARLHLPAGVLNAPTDTEELFVDCDVNDENTEARQLAIGIESKFIWVRYGVIEEEEPSPARADDEPDDDEPENYVTWEDWRKVSGVDGVVYTFKGSVETYDDLPEDAEAGDVYNIAEADEEHHIKAGDNVAWTGEEWDNLSGIFDTSGLETKISEVLQVANNAQDTASTAQSTADTAQTTADEAMQKALELLEQLLTVVNDVEYANSTLTVTKADGTTKEFTINASGLSGTVGSATQPVYLNDGEITACTTTVGGAAKPIYSNAGVLTAISNTVGSATQPIYSSSGTLTACNTTVGGTAKPIYSNAGVLTAISSTVGSSTNPVYVNSGTLTACSTSVANVTYSHSAESAKESAGKGYIKIGPNVMICYGGDADGADCTFAATFYNNPFIGAWCADSASSNIGKDRQYIVSVSTSKFSVDNTGGYTRYVAIGRYA